jgi:hypothetical protein
VQGRCIIDGAPGISDAFYCRECTLQEKDVRILCICYASFLTSFFTICREMDVQKLLIWEVLEQIYSTKEKNMDSRNDSSSIFIYIT